MLIFYSNAVFGYAVFGMAVYGMPFGAGGPFPHPGGEGSVSKEWIVRARRRGKR